MVGKTPSVTAGPQLRNRRFEGKGGYAVKFIRRHAKACGKRKFKKEFTMICQAYLRTDE